MEVAEAVEVDLRPDRPIAAIPRHGEPARAVNGPPGNRTIDRIGEEVGVLDEAGVNDARKLTPLRRVKIDPLPESFVTLCRR